MFSYVALWSDLNQQPTNQTLQTNNKTPLQWDTIRVWIG